MRVVSDGRGLHNREEGEEERVALGSLWRRW